MIQPKGKPGDSHCHHTRDINGDKEKRELSSKHQVNL